MCSKKGKVLIISAPSGAGKTTITKFLISKNLNLFFSVSACNRKKRVNETDGVDYVFLDTKEFKHKIKNNDFLEWEEVYKNKFYGTLKKNVIKKIGLGKNIILDIDVQGAMNLKKIFKKQSLSIYIDVPLDILESRLRNRGTESTEQLIARLDKIEEEKKYKDKFDVVIINKDLERTKDNIYQIASLFLEN